MPITTSFHSKFSRILVEDSTIFELPEKLRTKYAGSGGSATRAAIKVHHCIEILSGAIISIVNKSGIYSDQKIALPDLKHGDLLISDLGFFGIPRLLQIIRQQARYLSRLRSDVIIFRLINGEYKPFDLLKEEKKMKPGDIREYEVYITAKEKLFVRLILEKVDEKIAAEKRRKLKQKRHSKGKILSHRRLALCNINAYVTNTSCNELPKENVRNYYSLRWQIEILFKAWKSIYSIDEIRLMKLERFECMHYGLLTMIVLTHHIFMIYKKSAYKLNKTEISELKFYSCIKETLPVLISVLNCKQKLRQYLDMLWSMVINTCIKDRKKNKKSPLQILKMST